MVTQAVGEQAVSYFPGEDGRTLALVLRDTRHDARGRHARLTAADRPRSNRSRLVVAPEYLAHTAV